MDPYLREDYLEAILNTRDERGRQPVFADLADAMDVNAVAIKEVLEELVREGYCNLESGDSVSLTPEGEDLAARVRRKHQVLECFFTEMLGMDVDFAAQEACTLEHEISDETIGRLSSYLTRCPGRKGAGRRRGVRRGSDGISAAIPSILDFDEGARVRVMRIQKPGRNQRLADLGIVPGEELTIQRKLHNNSVVVHVKGCDVALSPEIALSIRVERSQ